MIASSSARRAGPLFAALALAACATPVPVPDKVAPPPPPADVAEEQAPVEPAPQATGLRFEVQPAEAEIVIGGESYGSAVDSDGASRVVSLPPGLYQVSIRHAGYTTWRAEVSVSDAMEIIRVSLVKR